MSRDGGLPTPVKLIGFLMYLGGLSAFMLSFVLLSSGMPYALLFVFVSFLLGIGSFLAGYRLLRASKSGWILTVWVLGISLGLDIALIFMGEGSIVRTGLTAAIILYLLPKKELFED